MKCLDCKTYVSRTEAMAVETRQTPSALSLAINLILLQQPLPEAPAATVGPLCNACAEKRVTPGR
jgi:hypothetical protein